MILIVIVGFIIIALIDLIPLIKQRKTLAIVAFSVFFALALTYGLLNAFDVEVPSIMKAWKSFFEWLGIAYKVE